jgi:predicted ester cyclase
MRKTRIASALLGLAGALLVVVGCSSKESSLASRQYVSLEESSRVFSAHDIERYATYYTDDFQWDVPGSQTPISRTDFIAFLKSLPKEDPNVYHFQDMTLVANNIAVFDGCSFVFTNPSTGMRYRTHHGDILQLEGLKIKVMTSFSDSSAAGVALGKIEPSVPAAPLPGTRVWPTPAPVAPKLKPLDAQKEALARWNKRDLDSIAKMIANGARIQYSALYDPVDRSGYVAWMGVMYKAFPDLSVNAMRTYDMGDGWVVSEVTMTGTNTGSYLGNAPTGKPFTMRAEYLGRYDSAGLMTTLHLYFNSMLIMKQLDLKPVAISAKK